MKIATRLIPGACVLLAALLSPACRSSGSVRADAQPILATQPVAGVPELEADIKLHDARFVQEAHGKVAYFALALETGKELDVLFHVAWSDAAQRPIAGLPQAWHTAHLVHGQPVPVRAPAPDTDAISFHILFQRPGAVH